VAQAIPPAPAGKIARPTLDLAIVITISLAVSISYAWFHGMPLPQYHDDFAYLLDGDTFAHGRMSNPTHPLWPHFETMHVLHVPRYISKYPMGQGLTFAAGSILFGHPLRAVWILGATACAVIWWALRAWMTPTVALLGGIATAVHPTMVEWMESYHGGALAALGGALLLGAAGRDRRLGAIAAIGVVLLAISRPYEGMIFCLAIGIVLIRRVTPAGVMIVLAGLAWIALNNRAITGSPFVLPYSIYEKQYDPVPNFLWAKARPMPQYRNAEMAFIYRVVYLGQYKRVHAPGGFLDETLKKIDVIDRAVFGPPMLGNPRPLFLLLLVAAIPLLRGDRKARLLAIILLIFAFAPFSIIWWMQLHYLAPAAAVAACLVMLLLRRLFIASPVVDAYSGLRIRAAAAADRALDSCARGPASRHRCAGRIRCGVQRRGSRSRAARVGTGSRRGSHRAPARSLSRSIGVAAREVGRAPLLMNRVPGHILGRFHQGLGERRMRVHGLGYRLAGSLELQRAACFRDQLRRARPHDVHA
jgi:hypothetical protein